jgi:hypothetical protein
MFYRLMMFVLVVSCVSCASTKGQGQSTKYKYAPVDASSRY